MGRHWTAAATYVLHFRGRHPARRRRQRLLVGDPRRRSRLSGGVQSGFNRYNLNSYSPLERGSDGSLTIVISPDEPTGAATTNWLPTDRNQPFTLTFRAYGPHGVVPFGPWAPPGLKRCP